MKNTEPASTSGYAKPLDFSTSNIFSNHEERGAKGYCRLFRAERYGKWHMLKGLQPQHAADPLYMAMLEKEFDTAVKMDHPNIVRTLGLESDTVAGPCIVMEYIDGRTLKEFLKEKPSASLRRKVTKQLLDAMEYYHAKQIVHRDLKPSNILVTYNGNNIKIIDFGLADTDDYAKLKEPAYTEGYAAPEQSINGAAIDCRTDLYAFGVILREIFPHRYRHIARRCTQDDPARRYRDASAVAKSIRRADLRLWCIPLLISILLLVTATSILPAKSLPEATITSDRADVPQTPVTDTVRILMPDSPTMTSPKDPKPVSAKTERLSGNMSVEEARVKVGLYYDKLNRELTNDIESGRITTQRCAHLQNGIIMFKDMIYIFQLLEQLKPEINRMEAYDEIIGVHLEKAKAITTILVESTRLSPEDIGDDELYQSLEKEYRQMQTECIRISSRIWATEGVVK